MEATEYLNNITKGFEKSIDDVINSVDGLSKTVLNIPEAEGKWSMLQCIKHMSLATQVYVENVEEKLLNGTYLGSSGSFKGSWKGRLFAKMNAPKPNGEIPNKLKTFKRMNPTNTLDREVVIDEFIATHQRFIELIKKSEVADLDKTKVATAIPVVKLKLGDAYKFILAHTQRHVVQLKRIKKEVLPTGAD